MHLKPTWPKRTLVLTPARSHVDSLDALNAENHRNANPKRRGTTTAVPGLDAQIARVRESDRDLTHGDVRIQIKDARLTTNGHGARVGFKTGPPDAPTPGGTGSTL